MTKEVLLMICVSMFFFVGCGNSADVDKRDNITTESITVTASSPVTTSDTESNDDYTVNDEEPSEDQSSSGRLLGTDRSGAETRSAERSVYRILIQTSFYMNRQGRQMTA